MSGVYVLKKRYKSDVKGLRCFRIETFLDGPQIRFEIINCVNRGISTRDANDPVDKFPICE
ncbi:hypothetical protein BN2475_1200009 [Paraburkholderia ribeironis]|uniref:Uncharacterized protein n=1 Tax=Paraburkholderia ribeironis TaxID=1247936 RepID=A0A1N7SNK6_9BURK|nr:hypothetical protein BN2475_1200009 [Paraburkholderia ribeironis]